jgi:ankyrin repeat protein
MAAARFGKFDNVQKLLDFSANTKLQDSYGRTDLHMAVYENHVDIVNFLLQNDPDLVITIDKCNWYPLHHAAECATPEMIELLLGINGDPNEQNDNRISALHLVVKFNEINSVRILLQHKNINVDLQDNYGLTTLHISALKGNFQIFKELVNAGADLSMQNKNGLTALDLAKKFENQQIVDYLSQDFQKFSLDQNNYLRSENSI